MVLAVAASGMRAAPIGRLRRRDLLPRDAGGKRSGWRAGGGPAIRAVWLHRRFGQVLHQALGLLFRIRRAGLRQHVVGGLLAEPDGFDVLEHDFAGGGREEGPDLVTKRSL